MAKLATAGCKDSILITLLLKERRVEMGVKVREKVKGSGEWWIFINHQGKRRSKKVAPRKRPM